MKVCAWVIKSFCFLGLSGSLRAACTEMEGSEKLLRPSVINTIDGYKREWSKYIRMCSDIPVQADDTKFDFQMDTAEKFWQTNYIHFNCLHNLARFVISISPSFGAFYSQGRTPRRFSIERSFLQDYVLAVTMAIYNDKTSIFRNDSILNIIFTREMFKSLSN